MQINIEHETPILHRKPLRGKTMGTNGDLDYTTRVLTKCREYNESSTLPERLIRCIYRTDGGDSGLEGTGWWSFAEFSSTTANTFSA
jgi:hypothetical protein